MGREASSRGVRQPLAGPGGSTGGAGASRQDHLIRALGWVGGLAALGGALADLPAVTFVAVFVAIGTMVATHQRPGHSTIAENALMLLIAGSSIAAFWPPLWF